MGAFRASMLFSVFYDLRQPSQKDHQPPTGCHLQTLSVYMHRNIFYVLYSKKLGLLGFQMKFLIAHEICYNLFK